jgi:geranylgeranyl diphosphate synthase type II
MGKATGTDVLHKKSTYPALLGLKQSRKLAHQLVSDALQALQGFDNRSDPLRALATYIIERNR